MTPTPNPVMSEARKTPAEERLEKAVAMIAHIEEQKAAPGASANQRQGVSALSKSHAVFLLRQAAVPVPDSGKGRTAALLALLQRPGDSPAARRRV